jgi:hypothetical protein
MFVNCLTSSTGDDGVTEWEVGAGYWMHSHFVSNLIWALLARAMGGS